LPPARWSCEECGVPSRSVGFGEALRRGFSLAWKTPGVVGLAFFAEVGADLLSLGAGLSVAAVMVGALERTLGAEPFMALADPDAAADTFLGQLVQGRMVVPLAGALLVAALLSLTLRLLWFASGSRVFGLKLAGADGTAAVPAAALGLRRAIPVAALFLPIYLAVLLYDFTALGASSLSYASALGRGEGGVSGSFAFALAIAIALFLGFASDSLLRLTLVRAVAGDLGPVDALRSAGKLFASRLPTLLGLLLVFAFLASFAGAIGGSGGALMLGTGSAAVALALTARFATGVVGSLVRAFFATAQLGAIATLDADDRGVLPQPVEPPPVVLATEPVVLTEPVLETTLEPQKPPA